MNATAIDYDEPPAFQRRMENPSARPWERVFLTTLERTGVIGVACEAAGISRQAAAKRRKRDPEFSEAWHEAEEAAIDRVEALALRIAADGYLVPVYRKRCLVGHYRAYDTRLMMFILRTRRRGIYGDAAEVAAASLPSLPVTKPVDVSAWTPVCLPSFGETALKPQAVA